MEKWWVGVWGGWGGCVCVYVHLCSNNWRIQTDSGNSPAKQACVVANLEERCSCSVTLKPIQIPGKLRTITISDEQIDRFLSRHKLAFSPGVVIGPRWL